MSRRTLTISRRLLAVLLISAAVVGAYAQPSGSADPGTVWDYADNPAAWGLFPDAMAFGLRGEAAAADLAAYAGGTLPYDLDLVYGVPGLLYRYRLSGGTDSHELTSAFSLGRMVGMGLRFRWDAASAAVSDWGFQDFGIMLRPFGYASLSASLDDILDLAGDGYDSATFGLSVRPLAFDPKLETMLTLSADASYAAGAFSMASVGARFMLGDWLSVHGRYEFPSSSFGVGVSVALSGVESSVGFAAPATAAGPEAGSLSLGQSVRLGRAIRPAARVFSTSVLLIDEPGVYAASPPLFDFDMGMGEETQLWFDRAVAAIHKATSDRSIGWLVMIEPPAFESDARAQEFSRVLTAFRAAGKPVYVYARSMGRLSYVYAAAGAELVALDPNGNLGLVDLATVGLYFKDLLAKLGIETFNLQSHDTKTAYNSFSESGMTDAERAMIERYVGGLAAQSYEALGAARGAKLPGGAAAAIGGGPYIDPTVAVSAGLVDALMYRDEFDDAVKEKTADAPTVDLRSYARERGLSWGAPVARKVAVVYLTGNIIEGPGVAGQSIGDSASELLASLRDDATVAGVLLRVDSGGGSALTSDHIAREVKKLKEAGKPVVVSMASFAASGGYYVSAYADRIVAEAGTITGSIGVTGMNFSFVGALEKLGIGADGVSAGDSGLFGNPFLPRRDGDDAVMRSGIEYIYGRFVDVVAEGRKMDKARVDELGKGQIWLGSEAVANGLIDEIGGLDAAKAAMAGLLDASVRYQDYLPGDNPVSPLMSMFGATLSPVAGAAGSISGAVLDAVRFADDVAAMGNGILYLAPEYLYRERP